MKVFSNNKQVFEKNETKKKVCNFFTSKIAYLTFQPAQIYPITNEYE